MLRTGQLILCAWLDLIGDEYLVAVATAIERESHPACCFAQSSVVVTTTTMREIIWPQPIHGPASAKPADVTCDRTGAALLTGTLLAVIAPLTLRCCRYRFSHVQTVVSQTDRRTDRQPRYCEFTDRLNGKDDWLLLNVSEVNAVSAAWLLSVSIS